MAKVRVYELAKEFGVESKAVMVKLNEMGEFARSASSTIEAPVVRRLKEAFAQEAQQQDAPRQLTRETPKLERSRSAASAAPVRAAGDAPESRTNLVPSVHRAAARLDTRVTPNRQSVRLDELPTDERRRWSLTLSVATFSGDGRSDAILNALRPLPFAHRWARSFGKAVGLFGYSRRDINSTRASAEDLGRAVENAIDATGPNEVLIVHVLSHGHVADSGALYVVGPDGRTDALTDVEQWLKRVENFEGRPYTLFLLDLCHSGIAARLPWQTDLAHGSSRAWVIAACQPDRQAFDGRFTQAVANVLRALRQGEMDIDRSVRYVPLTAVAREIRREVDRLSTASDSLPQQVTCSVIDISAEVELPFFPNPNYLEDERYQIRGRIDAALAPFLDDLDEAFDARHFISRATGHGPMADRIGSGCFSGRDHELLALTHWMNGDDGGAFRLVTGSAGVGKSALIGVLVCAAHSVLRRPTRIVWEGAARVPGQIAHMAAVHARQRGLAEITESLARQLGFPSSLSVGSFIERVCRSSSRPMLVVDAVDEALDSGDLTEQLLLPLASAHDADGFPACRLLVGVRSDPEFEGLREAAAAESGLIDLDSVEDERLRRDLEEYVDKLLKSQRPYDQRPHAPARAAFAAAVAETLVARRKGRRWGEFLIAALYTHHLLSAYQPIADSKEADALGLQVPHELPDVLELDLRHRGGIPWLRPVLAVLAYALGEGMPASLIREAAPAFRPGEPSPSGSDIVAALEAARFYLRLAPDTDGTSLYRLFHQGLADYLRQHPVAPHDTAESLATARTFLSYLLGGLPASADDNSKVGHNWSFAEPYLLRHLLQHALAAGQASSVIFDPDFLVHASPSVVGPFLENTSISELSSVARLYRSAFERINNADPAERRWALALGAAREMMLDLASGLANPPGQPPLVWQPVWAVGGRRDGLDTRQYDFKSDTDHAAQGPISRDSPFPKSFRAKTATILGLSTGPALIAADSKGYLYLWDLSTGKLLSTWPHVGKIDALKEVHIGGQSVVLAVGNRPPEYLERIHPNQLAGNVSIPLSDPDSILKSLGVGSVDRDGRTSHEDILWFVAKGDAIHGAEATNVSENDAEDWDPTEWGMLATYDEQGNYVLPEGFDPEAGEWIEGYEVQMEEWENNYMAARARYEEYRKHGRYVSVVYQFTSNDRAEQSTLQALSVINGRMIIISVNENGMLTLTDSTSGTPVDGQLEAPPGRVTALASCVLGNRPTLLAGTTEGSVCFWDLHSRQLRDILALGKRVEMIIPAPGNRVAIIAEEEIVVIKRRRLV